MAKKILTVVKLQLPAGEATVAPPVGPSLGQHGVNSVAFCKEYNERTQALKGSVIPAEVTIYADRSFAFVLKTPPTSDLLRKAAGVQAGSGSPREQKVGAISRKQLREIATTKLPDLNTTDIEAAERIIAGAACSMGIAIASE